MAHTAVAKQNCNPSSQSVKIQNLLTGIHSFSYVTNCENLLNINDSNFYTVILSLILITLSLDLCMDTVRRNLMLLAVGA